MGNPYREKAGNDSVEVYQQENGQLRLIGTVSPNSVPKEGDTIKVVGDYRHLVVTKVVWVFDQFGSLMPAEIIVGQKHSRCTCCPEHNR